MDEPIRILHVVVNMNRGGAETLIMNLYRNIDRSKIQFDFLTCKEGVFDKEIEEMGGKIYRIPYISEVGHSGYIKELKKFFESNNSDVIHSHLDKMSGLVLRVAKKYKIPVRIAHSHNTRSEGSFPARLYKWYIGKLIIPYATNYLACSESAAKWLFRNKKDKVVILKNGIECEKFSFSLTNRNKIREELTINENNIVIGHIGRFNHQKNHEFIIDIFQELIKINHNARLILVGDGVLKEKIEKKVINLNLEKEVLFLGIQENIDELLQAFDLFVFPSFHEGLPVTLIEAQGSGLPCIISDTITTEVDMGLNLIERFPLGKAEIWANKINFISNKKQSRSIQKEVLAKNGYDIIKTAKWLEKYYIELVRYKV